MTLAFLASDRDRTWKVRGREPRGKHGYVYILKADGGYYKIGKSKNPSKRVNAFASLPYNVELIHVIKSDAVAGAAGRTVGGPETERKVVSRQPLFRVPCQERGSHLPPLTGASPIDFYTAVANFGVAVTCLGFLGMALWVAIRWIAANILKPLTDRGLKFMDELSIALASHGQALQGMAANQIREAEVHQQIIESVQKIFDQIEKLTAQQARILAALQEVKSLDVHSDSVVIHQEPARRKP